MKSQGSSPRMRGTLSCRKAHARSAGIIPAYAGNTPVQSANANYSGDHPRVCGEHQDSSNAFARAMGSSPRMRGTLHQAGETDRRSGIIPAYAGNTALAIASRTTRGDHPRVCGEHLNGVGPLDLNLGSSPRMRGTQVIEGGAECIGGIIPAYAGNTLHADCHRKCHWDHPRVCGEHASCSATTEPVSGSSPRMRGTRLRRLRGQSPSGIIPAYAGNTERFDC